MCFTVTQKEKKFSVLNWLFKSHSLICSIMQSSTGMWVFTALNFQSFQWSCIFNQKKNTEMFYAFCVAVMSIIAIGSKTIILTQIFFYDV